jgi:hypothetical protein
VALALGAKIASLRQRGANGPKFFSGVRTTWHAGA